MRPIKLVKYDLTASVLIVEEKSVTQSELRDSCKDLGLNDVIVTSQLQRASDLLREVERNFDLVIVGESLREKYDGYEFIKRLKPQLRRGGALGVILTTWDGADTDMVNYDALGLDGYIAFPAAIATCVKIIRQVLTEKYMYKPVYEKVARNRIKAALKIASEIEKTVLGIDIKLSGKKLQMQLHEKKGDHKEALRLAQESAMLREESWNVIAKYTNFLQVAPNGNTKNIISQMSNDPMSRYLGLQMMADLCIQLKDYSAALRHLTELKHYKGVNIQLLMKTREVARIVGDEKAHIAACTRLAKDTANSIYANPEFFLDLSMAKLNQIVPARESVRQVLMAGQGYYLQYIQETRSRKCRHLDKLIESKILMLRGETARANDILTLLLMDLEALEEKFCSERFYDLNLSLQQVGRPTEAIRMLEKSLEMLPNDESLGHLKRDFFNKQLRDLTSTSMTLDELNARGVESYRDSHFAMARDFFIEAFSMDDTNVKVAINLLRAVCGDTNEYDKWLKQALIDDCMAVVRHADLSNIDERRLRDVNIILKNENLKSA